MQFKEAGVSVRDANAPVTPADKEALLAYLQQKTNKLTVSPGA